MWLVAALFSLAATAQEEALQKELALPANPIAVKDLLYEIQQQAGLRLSYVNNLLPLDSSIGFAKKKNTVQYFLDGLCIKYNLQYSLVEKQVIIKPLVPAVENHSAAANAPLPRYTLNGYVKDRQSGEVLPGANIIVKELGTGVSSNAYGFYAIALPEGQYTIETSYIGYSKQRQLLTLKQNTSLSFNISTEEMQVEEVLVQHNFDSARIGLNQMSSMNLKTASIQRMPNFMGEVELIKSMQSVPGINLYGDGSTFFYVRGGDRDQNLIVIDEAPVYNPSHLLGFFSSFTPDAIKDVEIYKGDIPASQGGRLSSLIDVKTKDGDMNKHRFNGSAGLIASHFTAEGPLKKERCSYFLSARRSNLEWFLPKQVKASQDLYFYDMHAKLNYIVGEKDRLFLSFYAGNDHYGTAIAGSSKAGISWGNNTATLRWNHIFGERVFSNTTLYSSKYNYYLYLGRGNGMYWNESIGNLNLKSDFTFFVNPNNKATAGISLGGQSFNPGNLNITEVNGEPVPHVPERFAQQIILYAGNDQQVSERFSARYGLRLNVWKCVGPSTVYKVNSQHAVYDTLYATAGANYKTYTDPEPRLSLRYKITEKSSLKGSYTRTVQNVQLLSNSIGPFTSLEVWKPSDPNIRPQKADQLALGIQGSLPKHRLYYSAETYYKKMKHLIDYEDHASLLLNPAMETDLRFGTGNAYGLELMLQRTEGKLNGWVAYCFSRSIRQTPGINNNNPYPAFYDRPHQFNLTLAYKPKERWEFTAGWIYASGFAITTPTGFYYYQGRQVPYYTEKNNSRLPSYHRLDLSATRQLNKDKSKRYQHHITFSIYNFYGRKNPFSINFNKEKGDGSKFVVPMNLLDNNDIVVTQLALLGFVPAINYYFSF